MLWFVKITKGLLGVLSRCHADGLRDRELLVTWVPSPSPDPDPDPNPDPDPEQASYTVRV